MPTISITVKDNKGRGVPFAAVTLGGIHAPTDQHGVAMVNVPRSGTMRLDVRTAIHSPYSKDVTIPPNQIEVTLTSARFG